MNICGLILFQLNTSEKFTFHINIFLYLLFLWFDSLSCFWFFLNSSSLNECWLIVEDCWLLEKRNKSCIMFDVRSILYCGVKFSLMNLSYILMNLCVFYWYKLWVIQSVILINEYINTNVPMIAKELLNLIKRKQIFIHIFLNYFPQLKLDVKFF